MHEAILLWRNMFVCSLGSEEVPLETYLHKLMQREIFSRKIIRPGLLLFICPPDSSWSSTDIWISCFNVTPCLSKTSGCLRLIHILSVSEVGRSRLVSCFWDGIHHLPGNSSDASWCFMSNISEMIIWRKHFHQERECEEKMGTSD